jgi:muramoyltetrapeptide carboxypeptidase
MAIRYPRPLRPGDRVGVTAPSSGVPAGLRPRLDFAIRVLGERGFEVVRGDCLLGDLVSAPAAERAAELQGMLIDRTIRAVVPPWGGELAVELLPLLDFEAIAAAEPTWLVGYSDMSTLLAALTARCGIATLHAPNLLDTPYDLPRPLAPWTEVAGTAAGGTVSQGPSRHHRGGGHDDWARDPEVTDPGFDAPTRWRRLDADAPLRARGRLIGGCIETVSVLAGTPFGDVAPLAGDGLIVYVEASEQPALDIARGLWRMRLAGWFDAATAVLVGRTHAPASGGFTQDDAVRSALAGTGVPVVADVDCGHVPPQLALVNGAVAELELEAHVRLVQRFV